MKMNKMIKNSALATLMAVAMAASMPVTKASAAPASNVNISTVTDATSEHGSFTQNLQKARQEIMTGNYDQATIDANEARRWFLAFADSVALEKPNYTWDNVRDMESDLVATYMDLGRLYHIAGKYSNAVNVLASSLSVQPYQPEARYQQMLAYVAMHDANDSDFDANDIDRIQQNLDRINSMEDLDNNGTPDAIEDLNENGIKDSVETMPSTLDRNDTMTQDQIDREMSPGY